MATQPDLTYQGWANYPTWAVNLWLDNDEPLYQERRDRTRQCIADANEEPLGVLTIAELARYKVEVMLKDWVTDELAPDLGASFAADLLGYALGEVDWRELAVATIEDLS